MSAEKQITSNVINFTQMRESAAQAVRLMKSLANENRLMIMCVLADGEFSVGELNQRIDLSQSALSQHLAVLREQGLVKTRRESQTIHYSLADTEAISLIERLHELFCEDGDDPARSC
jgi:DNA-binding transcriptional ArsR family regulator